MSQLLSAVATHVACCTYSILKTFEGECTCKLLCLPENKHNGFCTSKHPLSSCNFVNWPMSAIHVFVVLTPHCRQYCVPICTVATVMLCYSCCPCNNNSTFLGQLRQLWDHALVDVDYELVVWYSLYVGRAWQQDVGSNQYVNIYMALTSMYYDTNLAALTVAH